MELYPELSLQGPVYFFLAADLPPVFEAFLTAESAAPVTSCPASAAPATAPSAAPAAALDSTFFKASLARLRIPEERPFRDLLADFLVEVRFCDFLVVFFALVLVADLVDFFLAGFLVAIYFPLQSYPHEATLPQTSEEALPAVDDALTFPPGPVKRQRLIAQPLFPVHHVSRLAFQQPTEGAKR